MSRCAAGAAAGLDLCLHVVRRDFGAEVATRTARLAVMPLERAGGQAQFIVHEPPSLKDKGAIGPLLLWIEKNVHKELSLPVIARQAAMSTRTLSRRFVEGAGATPAWVAAARVRRAQQLLEITALSVKEIAVQAGFCRLIPLLRRPRFSRAIPLADDPYGKPHLCSVRRHTVHGSFDAAGSREKVPGKLIRGDTRTLPSHGNPRLAQYAGDNTDEASFKLADEVGACGPRNLHKFACIRARRVFECPAIKRFKYR
jgi:AraC-like DNA-binding protein